MKGTVRVGSYVLEHELAGGVGETHYLARHAVLPRRVLLRVAVPDDREVAVHMLREACVLEALGHGGVPRMYECGSLPGARPWLAVEPLDGDTVASALAIGPLVVTQVIALVRGVAETLAHAHALGIVHGAVRPEVIVLRDGRPPCVTDWRSARVGALDGSLDVLALGLIARQALGNLRVPAPLVALIETMLDADVAERPSAAAVAAEAARLNTPGALEDGDDPAVIVEDIVLVETPAVALPESLRVRWTPSTGYEPPATPPAGVSSRVPRKP
jgi:serine/threonine protein kinase